MRISDWSSDVCSSDLIAASTLGCIPDDLRAVGDTLGRHERVQQHPIAMLTGELQRFRTDSSENDRRRRSFVPVSELEHRELAHDAFIIDGLPRPKRSEEHTSELQSIMRISYAVFCLNKKKIL